MMGRFDLTETLGKQGLYTRCVRPYNFTNVIADPQYDPCLRTQPS